MGATGEIQIKVEPWQDVGTGVAAALEGVGLAAGVLDRHAEVDGVVRAERLSLVAAIRASEVVARLCQLLSSAWRPSLWRRVGLGHERRR